MNLGGQLIWISLVEQMDDIGCVGKMFRWFPTCGIQGIVKPFPLDKAMEPQSLAMVINPAVEDLMDFPLV